MHSQWKEAPGAFFICTHNCTTVKSFWLWHTHASVTCGDSIYSIGGHDGSQYLNSVERYDIQTDQWISISPMNQAYNLHAAVSIGESIFVLGGWNDAFPLKSVEMYDTRSNKWMEITPINTARRHLAAAICGNSIFAIGGYDDSSALKTVEKLVVYFVHWSLSNHKYCSGFLKRQIDCLLMMCLCDTVSRKPRHPQCALAFIPKDILIVIFGFLSIDWMTKVITS